jgi:hypothetical protein
VKQLLSRVRNPLIVLGVCLACLFVHELGHAVGAFCTGQQITTFVVLSLQPHVNTTGPSTPWADAWTAAAGSGMMLFSWLLVLLLPGSTRPGPFLEALSGFAFVEILGWVLSSIWPEGGAKPNDAERFLSATGASPWLVVGVLFFVAFTGAMLLLSRKGRGRRPGAVRF